MRSLTFTEQLDVAWAHQMQMATSGAFSNPFEMQELMDSIYYGTEISIKQKQRDVTGQKGSAMKAPPAEAIRRMNELNAALRAQTAAAPEPSPTLADDG